MRVRHAIILISAALPLGGCLARTAVDVATAPVRIASRAVDLATTSQSEADEARGREIRRREERLAEMQDEYAALESDCLNGNDRACRDAVEVRSEIDHILPMVPLEPVQS